MENALLIQNEWTVKQEQLLSKWHKNSANAYWKHNESAKLYLFRHKLIGLPATVANAITGTAIFITLNGASQCNSNTNGKIMQAIFGSVILFVTILMAMQNFLNPSQLAEKHINSANKYKNYADSIEAELVLPREERMNGKIFLKQTQKRLSELREICPEIPSQIEIKFKQIIKTEEFSDLTNIIINDDIFTIPVKQNSSKNIELSINKNNHEDLDNKNIQDDQNNNTDNGNQSLQKEIEEELEEIQIKEKIRGIEHKDTKSKTIIERFVNNF